MAFFPGRLAQQHKFYAKTRPKKSRPSIKMAFFFIFYPSAAETGWTD